MSNVQPTIMNSSYLRSQQPFDNNSNNNNRYDNQNSSGFVENNSNLVEKSNEPKTSDK